MTEAADGLMSHVVVILTADGKLLTALSVSAAMLCDAPEFTTTVNDVAFVALNDTVSMFDVRPACADAFAAKVARVAIATGRVRNRIIQANQERGDRHGRGSRHVVVLERTNRTEPFCSTRPLDERSVPPSPGSTPYRKSTPVMLPSLGRPNPVRHRTYVSDPTR